MGKTSQKRLTRRQGNTSIGCMSGLIRMLYSRHDAKLLLDRKQGSTRHSFSAFPGRGHSRKNSRDLDEIDQDGDNMEECSSNKPTVKRLMDDELTKSKQLKIPNDEVQRILADLGHGECLDKSSMQNSKSKGYKNHSTSVNMAIPSTSLGPSSSNGMKQADENELEFALADFLGQIHKHHDEWPHKNFNNKTELCKEMKFLIQTKLNELDNPPCSLAYEKTPQGEEKDCADGRHLCSSGETQPEKFIDALGMLGSDTELFFRILQKPNSHILEGIQRHQNREPAQIPKGDCSVKDTKTTGKESRHIFFWNWKKERSNTRHTVEGNDNSQPVNKIVILKPNPRRGIDPAVAASLTQAPELGATENSKFSIKEVRRRFRIVTSEFRKGRPPVNEDNLQQDSNWLKSSAFTIKKGTRQLAERTSEEKALSSAKKELEPSTSTRQNQRNDEPGGINSDIATSSKDESVFYDEAKKHLTEILKDRSQIAKHPTLEISRSLVRMLSLPQCSTPSPRSSPRAKDSIYLSHQEANICSLYNANGQSGDIQESVASDDALHKQSVQERSCIKENQRDGAELETVNIEEIDRQDCLEKISYTMCIPAEQCIYNNTSLNMVEEAEPGKEHAPENVVEKSEYQEPATPRSSASIEQFSPEGNHEKQEQPSPVSVLDSCFFHEDADNPESESIIKCEDIVRPRYTADDGSDQGSFWEDQDFRLSYIKALLELSELCTNQNLEVWYLEDELISPCLFEEVHQGNQVDDTKLFFDCICEAVTEIQNIYFRSHPCVSSLRYSIRAPPRGQNLISEINRHVERHLHHQFPSTLDRLVNKDLEDGSWMDLRSESEEISVVIWDCILDEVLEEVVFNLWIEA